MNMRWFLCLLVLSPFSNAQTHLTAGQWSLRHNGATGFVRLSVVLHHYLCYARDTVVLLIACSHILARTLNPPRMSCLRAASCFLPIALYGTNVV